MARKLLLAVFTLSGLCQAALQVFVYPNAATPFIGGTQSVYSVVTGAASNNTVTWSITAGTCTFVGNTSRNTVGVKSTTAQSCSVKATSNQDNTTNATATFTFQGPQTDLQQSNTHPRIWMTPTDITFLTNTKIPSANAFTYNYSLKRVFYGTQGSYTAGATTNTDDTGGLALTSYWNKHFCWTYRDDGTTNSATCTLWTRGGAQTFVTQPGEMDDQARADDGDGQILNYGGTQYGAWIYGLMSQIDANRSPDFRTAWWHHSLDILRWEFAKSCGLTVAQFNAGNTCTLDWNTAGTAWNGWEVPLVNRADNVFSFTFRAADLIYSHFTANDKTQMRSLFLLWGEDMSAHGAASSFVYPNPVGCGWNGTRCANYDTGSTIYFTTGGEGNLAWLLGNYGAGAFNNIVEMSLVLDPADDPALTVCPGDFTAICGTGVRPGGVAPFSGQANSVRAYGIAAIGSWLKIDYANLEDSHIVASALGLADAYTCPDSDPAATQIPCFGQQSGGFTSEGTQYGPYSLHFLFEGLLAAYKAGKLDVNTDPRTGGACSSCMPQANLLTSAYWDKTILFAQHYLIPEVVDIIGCLGCAPGGQYEFSPFGDAQSSHYDAYIERALYAVLLYYDGKYSGNTNRREMDKFLVYNTPLQGFTRVSYADEADWSGIDVLMALDQNDDSDFGCTDGGYPSPCAAASHDVRSTKVPLEVEFTGNTGGFYQYHGRTAWTAAQNATGFSFACQTTYANHAHGICDRIEYYRKGDTMIYPKAGYNDQGIGAQYNNGAGYQWGSAYSCTTGADATNNPSCSDGGQTTNSQHMSLANMVASSYNPTYYYGADDVGLGHETAVDPTSSANVTLAQRDVFWLKNDLIWVYDRATTNSSTSFKRFYLTLTALPTVSGSTATMTVPAGAQNPGQKLFVTTLLPSSGSMSASMNDSVGNLIDTLHPFATHAAAFLTVSAGANPGTSYRGLNVMQGVDYSGVQSTTSLVQSTSGNAFDGARVGTSLVMFMGTRGTFTSTVFAVPSNTTTYVTGLTASTTYYYKNTAGSMTVSSTALIGGSSATSDSGGVLTIGPTAP